MKNLIYDFKYSIWKELRDNFLLCIDIGEFNDDLFYGEDIPRVFYDNKVVLPNKIAVSYTHLTLPTNREV